MMYATRIAILGSLLFLAPALRAEETSVLNDVSSSVVGGHCRIAFEFTGEVRFSTEQGKNSVRIVFSRTRAASMQVLAKKILSAGPVESITFQRPAPDSIIATLTLLSGSTYRSVCPASGIELFVDVRGSAAVRQPVAAAKPAQVRTHPAAPPPAPVHEPAPPASSSSLIDIPGVARRQMEQENVGDVRRADQANTGTLARPTIPVLLISVSLSLLLTAVVLVLAGRAVRSAQPVAASAVPEPERAPQPFQVARALAAYQEDDDMKPEPERVRALFSAPMREEEPEEDFGRETSLQLARTFRRGSEEITLARKFHENPTSPLTPAKMQNAMSHATTKTQRLTAARKMGVGRGEFDLAEKLKTLSQAPVKKEEPV